MIIMGLSVLNTVDNVAPALAERSRWLAPALWLLGLSLLGFAAVLGLEIADGRQFGFDTRLLLALRLPGHLATPIGPSWLQQSAIDISALGGFTLMWLFGAAGLALLIRARRRSEAIWFAASIIGASVLNSLLKLWLRRPRPELVPHLEQVSSASFPSGHAMISAAVYLTLGLMLGEAWPEGRRPLLTVSVVLVLLIGMSRVYLGVHWPSDVLAGWSIGAAWALAMLEVNRWSKGRSGPLTAIVQRAATGRTD